MGANAIEILKIINFLVMNKVIRENNLGNIKNNPKLSFTEKVHLIDKIKN